MSNTVDKENHSRTICFRVSKDEYEAINRKFKNSGMKSRSDFIRILIFEGVIIKFKEEDLKKMFRLIGNMASNINQVAVRVNRTNKVYADDLKEIQERQNELWQLLNTIRLKLQKLEQ